MTEIWKDIEGYQGYQVSNFGRVRSVDRYVNSVVGNNGKKLVKGITLKARAIKTGYMCVVISNKTLYIHRAVAMAFVPGYFAGAEVNHKDENRQNNRYDNLEWVSHKDNLNYGSHNTKMREKKTMLYGCPVDQYTPDGQFVASYPSIRAAARAIGAYQKDIKRTLGTQYTAKGYTFKRKTN